MLPLIFLFLGIFCGRFGFYPDIFSDIDFWVTVSLSAVVFSAGVDVGAKKIVLRMLKQYRAKVLLIPLGTVTGSLLGGALLGGALKIPFNEAAAVSAGFAYYSLSSGILANLGGAELGAFAFVANVFRELLSFLLIPPIARYISPYCAIAPGGATTMDITFCAISCVTDEETSMMAMINGIILTTLVPVLVPFLYSFNSFIVN